MTRPLLIFMVIMSWMRATDLVAQTFTDISPGPGGGFFRTFRTADLDNDGDPDIVTTDYGGMMIMVNDGGTFNNILSFNQFPGESQIPSHSLDVGDIDRDGTIDILQAGGPNNRVFRILLNNNLSLTEMAGIALNGRFVPATYLGDFDHDGDLDIVYCGESGGILLNSAGKFIDGPWFTRHDTWYATWGDLDADPQLEVVQSVGGSNFFIANYILQSGSPAMIVDKTLTTTPFIYDAVFADYDHDGDLDMLWNDGSSCRISNNVNGAFVTSNIVFPWGKTADFADVNNDGLYDVVIGGTMPVWQQFITSVFINKDDGTFAELAAGIAGCERCSAGVADVDDDGDLDILATTVYRNNISDVNAKPVAPAILGTQVSGATASFSWQAGTDDKTPVKSLTYNLHVRAQDGSILLPGHALPSGKRQLYRMGNASNKLSFDLSCLKQGTYYWKVQTIDAAFQGSVFSQEQSFTVTAPAPASPVSLTAAPVSDIQIDLAWTDASTTEDGFIILRKDPLSGNFNPIDTVAANSTHFSDLNLQASTLYSYRIIASNCAYPDQAVAETSASTLPRAYIDSGWLQLDSQGFMPLLGDIDNDGDLDLLLNYYGGNSQAKLYRFDMAGYSDSNIQLPVAYSATWLDFNNDGYIDILFGDGKLYKNIEGTDFVPVEDSLFPLDANLKFDPAYAFADYDNDGDQDVIQNHSTLFENNGKGAYTNTTVNFPRSTEAVQPWADFDRDGDWDLLGSKVLTCNSAILVVYENKGNKTFTAIEYAGLEGLDPDNSIGRGDMSWGDYDQDGYPDIVIVGQNTCSTGVGITKIYHNNGNKTFTLTNTLVPVIDDVTVDWGDYDNDGDLDIFAYGDPRFGASSRPRIYRNDGGVFTATNINYLLNSIQYGGAVPGDIDGDGDLDYVVFGSQTYINPAMRAYQSTYAESWGRKNHKPTPPSGLSSVVQGDRSVTLSWSAATDQETGAAGLTYNMYLIDESDSIISNSYSQPNGVRKIVGPGNVSSRTSISLKNLQAGVYRWAVQAIDNGYLGSEFSAEGVFEIIVTGLEDRQKSMVKIYPIPTRDFLTIERDSDRQEMRVVITDLLGQRVLDESISGSRANVDLSRLSAGAYLVTLTDAGIPVTNRKVIKVN